MDTPEFMATAPALPGSVAFAASRLLGPEPADTEPADLEPPPFPVIDLMWFEADAEWLDHPASIHGGWLT
jgi:hypothetical protein